jgi:hypothetical protein
MADESTTETKKLGRPLKFQSVKELQDMIQEFFDDCDPHTAERQMENGVNSKGETIWITRRVMTEQKPYTVSGLAAHLETTRDVLLDYESGIHDNAALDAETNATFSNTIKNAKARIEAYAEGQLFTGKQAAGPIFNLKNNFGRWKDQSEVLNKNQNVSGDLDSLDDDKEAVAAEAAKALTPETPAAPPEDNPPENQDEPGPPPTQ